MTDITEATLSEAMKIKTSNTSLAHSGTTDMYLINILYSSDFFKSRRIVELFEKNKDRRCLDLLSLTSMT